MATFTRLSEIIPRKTQHRFLREFKAAILSGEVEAIQLADTFKLMPARKGAKAREVNDYAVQETEALKAWRERIETKLSSTSRGMKDAPTFADVVAGKVRADEMVNATRQYLERERKRSERQKEARQGHDQNKPVS